MEEVPWAGIPSLADRCECGWTRLTLRVLNHDWVKPMRPMASLNLMLPVCTDVIFAPGACLPLAVNNSRLLSG